MIEPAVLRPDGPLLLWHPRPIAASAAALVAWRTRSVIATLLVGGFALVGLPRVGIAG